MSVMQSLCAGLAFFAITACSTSPSTKNSGANDIQVAAQRLVGQPAERAFEVFGAPDQGMGPSSYGSGGFYAWNRIQTRVTPEKVFIQTGVEYVGQQERWVGIGGRGLNGIMPVSSEPIYRKVGYEENRIVIDYFCSITLLTDGKDVITDVSVVNCNDKK
ncbi:hypothetical protein C4K03_4122 [Pseudomonas synxantha]|uniref:Lipoprotein n=1 Tax=Pseudomonas synxantha TaxID=47883 RepID=A0A3G7UA94_9PSED|nr:hypothetical protein [Pseudomonas synxantha]AZE56270.1 hypothetical protein C4K03_4122 [Pseudomonas synxantha]